MYTSSLTLEQVADGRLKALRNAEELVRDARCLYRKRRWPRALFLSQIAVEEAGKYFYLFSSCVAIVKGSIKWPLFWKTLRSHTEKTTLFLMMEGILLPGPDDPRQIAEFQGDARVLERAKMWSLYSDYETKEFFAPSEVIAHAMAKQALHLARNRVRLARLFESSADWSSTVRRITPSDISSFEEFVKEKMKTQGVPDLPPEGSEDLPYESL